MEWASGDFCALVELLAQLAPLIGRPVDRQHAIGDLTRLHNIFGTHRRNINRQVSA